MTNLSVNTVAEGESPAAELTCSSFKAEADTEAEATMHSGAKAAEAASRRSLSRSESEGSTSPSRSRAVALAATEHEEERLGDTGGVGGTGAASHRAAPADASLRTEGGRRRAAARSRRLKGILHCQLRCPEERQRRQRTGSRQSLTRWSDARQRKHPSREAGRDSVLV